MLEGLQDVIKADSAHSTKVDCNSSVEEYINKSDWRINANANTGYSSAGLVNNLAGKLIANYWLDKVYNKREGDAHRNGDYHIHDLDILGAYCCGHDLMRLLNEGFNGVTGRVSSHAPKHFREALYQMANYIGILQSEWAGAQAFSSFDTYLAPYVFFDMNFLGITVDDVKKAIKNFVFNLNVPSRWGQSPFSNVTIDVTVPNDLKDLPPNRNNQPIFLDIYEEYKDRLDKDEELSKKWNHFMTELRRRLSIGGTDEDLLYAVTYKDFLPEMEIIDIAFYEVLNEGDINGMPFTFPIPTINITEDFDWNSRVANVIFENAAKYGSSYFQNFIGSQYKRNPITGKLERDPNAYKPNDVRSMCCRLQLDKTQLRKRGGGLFGADAQTGSVGVVTINMARLGYLYKGDEKLLVKKLDTLMELAKSTLEKKRKFVVEMNKRGLYPYTRRYLKTFDTFFSTIGVNGMNEMVRNFTNDEYNITDPRGKDMCLRILDHIREKLLIFQEETGNLYNLEATPGEGTTYRFAKEDKKRFDDIIQAGVSEAPYYTNSSQIPVNYTADAFEALDLQDELQCKYTGGTVLHLYMSEPLSSTESCKKLVKSVLTNYRLPYVSVTPTYSICPIHGYIPGEHEYCPYCDKEIITEHAEEVDMNS